MRPEAEKVIAESSDAVDEVIKSYGHSHQDSFRRELLIAVRIAAIRAYGVGFDMGAAEISNIYRGTK